MHLKNIKKSAFVTLALLLVGALLLVTASYAWLTISRSPGITHIETNIGANGSLEIALLSNATYEDPSLIRTVVGGSAVVQEATVSNLSWGNVIDLSSAGYGLGEISLFPAMLNVSSGGDGRGVVSGNMLSYTGFGSDGRVERFEAETVSTVYKDEAFTYSSGTQSYGVRAIGSVSNIGPQEAALASARSAVRAAISGAGSAAESVWRNNGAALLDIFCKHYIQGQNTFDDTDVAAIRNAANSLLSAYNYIDTAVRQGIVGYAASLIQDVETFRSLRSVVENTGLPLSLIVKSIPAALPSGYVSWINTLDESKTVLKGVISTCGMLKGGSYSWDQIDLVLSKVLNGNYAYFGEKALAAMNASTTFADYNALRLAPNAGVMVDIAGFVGNYSVFFQYKDRISVEVITLNSQSTPFLNQLADMLDNSNAVDSGGVTVEEALNDIYGFAMDTAFRCNAASDLLLQTSPTLRVEEDGEFTQTQGGGSYMRFTSEDLNTDQIVRMMDAVRVCFMDSQNTVLAMAKLNTSNYTESEDGVSAQLYLYEYSVSSDGQLLMGERRPAESAITPLVQNTPTVVTIVVWLDGGYVDNTLAANSAKSMSGILNLQFASSAELVSSELEIEDLE